MGLTLHFRLTAPADFSARNAAALVRRIHARASRWAAEGRIERVLPISSDRVELDQWACAFLTLPHPEEPDTSIGVSIPPEAGWIFPIELGADSELLWFGLCRYPATIVTQGRNLATRLGPRWQFAGFCKTQYASLHGWEHFARCHVAAIDLLALWRAAGVRVKISDEGGYWPHRNLAALRRHLDQMNRLVAAFGGALKDATDESGGAPVQSPIFAHPQFERLEAEGLARNADHIRQAVSVVRKTPGE